MEKYKSVNKPTMTVGHFFFLIRVGIDVEKPLRRELKFVAVIHGEVMRYLRYEHFPYICFYCGCMGHTLKHYPTTLDLSKE